VNVPRRGNRAKQTELNKPPVITFASDRIIAFELHSRFFFQSVGRAHPEAEIASRVNV
jgi:hypothetical protein